MEKNKKIPKWIEKSFKPGEEDEAFSFHVTTIAAFYFLGIVWLFRIIPFETVYIAIAFVCIIVTSALLIWLYYWLSDKVEVLKIRRNGEESDKDSRAKKDVKTTSKN